jgi:apolipoprotein N-acyltransferase
MRRTFKSIAIMTERRGGFPRIMIQLALAALSGGLLALCFPIPGFSWLVWFALLPLLVACRKTTTIPGFVCGFTCGAIFFGISFSWALQADAYRPLHHAILHTYLGCYIGVFGLLYGLIGRKSGDTAGLLTAPFIWTVIEYARSNLGFLSYPTTLLGHSQYQTVAVTQIAAFAGVYGVSFLIVLVNSGLTALIFMAASRFRAGSAHPSRPSQPHGIRAVSGLSFLAIAATTCYGIWISQQEFEGTPVKISILQGNISQELKWDPRHAAKIMETYERLSRAAAEQDPKIIIWPESATPGSVNGNARLRQRVQNIADTTNTFLLLGSSYAQKFKESKKIEVAYHNSAFLIAPQNRQRIQRYDKIRLLPFGEYLPYREWVPWHWIGIQALRGFLPGKDFTIFKIEDLHFAVNICWETIFPSVTRAFVKRGAQFVVNLSNLAWFGKSAGPYQALSINVFRAIENGVFLVRSANTGVSCIIDPHGRITGRVRNEQGEDRFVEGILTGYVIPLESKTLYTRFGDWWVALSLVVASWTTLAALLRRPS